MVRLSFHWCWLAGCFLSLLGCASTTEKQEAQATQQKEPTEQEAIGEMRKKTILFFGDSITEGYGVLPAEAYPQRIDEYMDSIGLPYRAVNAGLSGETSSGGLNRLDWVLDQYTVDVFVLELGGNDGLRGINPEETAKNLDAITQKVAKVYPKAEIVIAGMDSPPNMGADYRNAFQRIFYSLSRKYGYPLIPFILEGVAGDAALNLPDGIHPTPEGHQRVALHVFSYLRPLLDVGEIDGTD